MNHLTPPCAATTADSPPLCVLKFGSSVLEDERGYRAVSLEIYRHVRDGEKVLAVVSAGLVLGFRAPEIASPESRMQGYAMWSILTFLLNAALFGAFTHASVHPHRR